MKNIAIITARGGSKRIPRKNIKDFLGRPMIAYPILAAKEAGIFDDIIVSTDDEEIARIAKERGASVPFMRSAETSNDYATTFDVLDEVIQKLADRDIHPENVCCIYPTTPFLTDEILKESFQKFQQGKFDSLLPVVKFDFPIQRALKEEKGKVIWVEEKYALMRSQDLELRYHDVGQFYWLKLNTILKAKKIITDNTGLYELDPKRAQDIDAIEDWEIAEIKYQYINKFKR